MEIKNTKDSVYFSADLGASSGRMMVAHLSPASVAIDEVYRFENYPIEVGGELYWDIERLLAEVKEGLRRALKVSDQVRSFAIDTWGTDFGFVDEAGKMVALPYSYRQFTDAKMVDLVRQSIPDEALYGMTGIQFIHVNSLFQLMAVKLNHPETLEKARWLLMIPDLLNCLLTGQSQSEYTDASTTDFLSPLTRTWEKRIFDKLDLPFHLLPPLVQPGTLAGKLLPAQAAEIGFSNLLVRSCAAHDTASAVAAVPAIDDAPYAYISSGTWLLVGTELNHPIVTKAALEANVTNEAGVNGTIRLLKNLNGLWLIQRLRHDLQMEETSLDFNQLVEAAQSARPFQQFIFPNDYSFHNPERMMAAIDAFCARTNQPAPQNVGGYARCIFESLAFTCAGVIADLERLTGQRFARVHIVGGGAQNRFLNACIANACGVDVFAGPIEATAIGNAIVQGMADGLYPDLASARRAIAASFPPEVFHPHEASAWEAQKERFAGILRLADQH